MFRRAAQLLAMLAMLTGIVSAQCNFACSLEALKAASHPCCPAGDSHTPSPQPCPEAAVLPGINPATIDLGTASTVSLVPVSTSFESPLVFTARLHANFAESKAPRYLSSFAILRI
ncbi:MAG: hypothetical protein JWN34_4129 [Bryobacterales bacterium]|nr:hypothetical protein [Bryobacterales bacterium]